MIQEVEDVHKKLRIRNEPITYFAETFEQKKQRLADLEKKLPLDYKTGKELPKIDEMIEKVKEKQREEELEIENEGLKDMTSNEKKLHDLREKMNKCRKANLDEVVKEGVPNETKQ